MRTVNIFAYEQLPSLYPYITRLVEFNPIVMRLDFIEFLMINNLPSVMLSCGHTCIIIFLVAPFCWFI